VVTAGSTYIDPMLAGALVGHFADGRARVLTARERQILRLLADGRRDDGVARELSISVLTVRTHVRNAMAKLESDTRTHAVAEALRRSLIR
jgi:DNA-binding NarL/FixJ family response regulator